MRALIVDDELLQRRLVEKTIDWKGLDIQIAGEAEDGEEALEKALALKPEIVIMDINIPYMNGIEVSKRIKEELPDTQIVILTAYGEFSYAREALVLGAVSFVLKPVNPEELTEELRKCSERIKKIRLHEVYARAYEEGKGRQSDLSMEAVSINEFLRRVSYEPEKLLYLLRKKEYAAFLDMVESYFQRMKEENGTSQTVNYVAADILVRFSAYLSELGIDFAEEMKREQTRLSGMSEDGSLGDMKEILMLILQEGLRLAEHHRIPATKRKVQDARDFIDQNYHRFDMSLNLVAENIGVNASYLSNIFKKECGCSLSRYLSNIRLENAKRLMEENPVRTLMDISEAVGFSDVYYFSKNFKSVYGISPSKYQEELR